MEQIRVSVGVLWSAALFVVGLMVDCFFFVLLLFLWSSENKDGKLSKKEFSNLDTDGDGAVDRDELMAFMHKELGYEVCQGENSFAETVLRMGGDADHDGVLTWDEVQKMHRSKVHVV